MKEVSIETKTTTNLKSGALGQSQGSTRVREWMHLHIHFSSFVKKINCPHKNTMRRCQEHTKPKGGNITLTINQPEAWKNTPTSQAKISSFTSYTTALQQEFLKIFTLAWVFKNVRFKWPDTAFACVWTAKPHRKKYVFWKYPCSCGQGHRVIPEWPHMK